MPDFPDPNSHGFLTLARKDPLAQEENTAMGICARLLSHPRAPLMLVGRVSPRTLLRFSDCMRANGLPGYPDLGSGMKVAAYATTSARTCPRSAEQRSPAAGCYRSPRRISRQAVARLRGCSSRVPATRPTSTLLLLAWESAVCPWHRSQALFGYCDVS